MIKQTIQALTATPGTPTENYVHVLCYTDPGDGGGGDFYWNATSTKPQDDGLVFQVVNSSGPGRWERVYYGAVNAKWFGVKGDGLTDDTQNIKKAFMACDNLYFDKGEYNITSQIIISKTTAMRVTSSPEAFLRKRFVGNTALIFKNISDLYLSLNAKDSKPDTLKFMDSGSWEGVPQMILDGIDAGLFNTQNCDRVTVTNCNIKNCYGRFMFNFNGGFVTMQDISISDCLVDAYINTDNINTLIISDSIFTNCSVMPDEFFVVTNNEEIKHTYPATPYAFKWGNCIGIHGKEALINNCKFVNIAGNSIAGHYNDPAPQDPEVVIRISGNIFHQENERLRSANPPTFIWLENSQNGIVTSNRFIYKTRGSGGLGFNLLRFVFAQTFKQNPYFEYSENVFLGDLATTAWSSHITVATENEKATVVVRDNHHDGGGFVSNFLHLGLKTTGRICDTLVVQNNTVKCKDFVRLYNFDNPAGALWAIPKMMNIFGNTVISQTPGFFTFFGGRIGDSDGVVTIKDNVVQGASSLYLYDGRFKAIILNNHMPAVKIVCNSVTTGIAKSEFTVEGNTIADLIFTSNHLCGYDVKNNTITGLVQFRSNVAGSTAAFKNNIFNQVFTFTGPVIDTSFSDNTFAAGIELVSATRLDFVQNRFYAPLKTAATGSITLNTLRVIDNTFLFSAPAVGVDATASFAGKNYIIDNYSVPATGTPTAVTNISNPNVVVANNYPS